MSALKLTLSEKFNEDNAKPIQVALSRHLQVSNPVFVWRRSIDPPSTIQLLGEAVAVRRQTNLDC